MWPEDAVAICWRAAGRVTPEQLGAARQAIIDAGLYPLLQRLGVRAVVVDPDMPIVTDDSTSDLFEADGIIDTVKISDRIFTGAGPAILPAIILHAAMHLYQQRYAWGGWGLEVMAYTANLIFHLLNGERIPVFDGAVYGGAKEALAGAYGSVNMPAP